MERESDVQLIQRILSGDEAAFGVLVEKHQKSVHALAWRKIGDFHDAEEITQDTFLDALRHLEVVNINGNFRVGDYISRIAVGPRIKERGSPSIFAAWSGNDILNLPNLSDDEKLIYHDLFWGGLGFHLSLRIGSPKIYLWEENPPS